jgi:hypothetical protein
MLPLGTFMPQVHIDGTIERLDPPSSLANHYFSLPREYRQPEFRIID